MYRAFLRKAKVVSVTFAYVTASVVGLFSPELVRADATIAYAGSTVSGMVEDTIALPGISVGGTDPTIPISLTINDGYLFMTSTTGLVFASSSRASTLSFSGSVSDINAALATLSYRSIVSGTKTLTATISGPGVVYFPGNGHLYEVVDHGAGLDWDVAMPLAAARTMNGATGYLATVTSQEENDYLVGRLTGDGWFGASDAGVEGDWQWVTGPEAGTSFWAGLGDGAPVGGLFSNWSSGEPNDASGEDCSQFYSSGSGWNDLPCSYNGLNYYVVEYGAPGDLPTAPESVSFSVEVSEPTSAVVNIDSCLDLLDVQANGADNRYDTLRLTTNIDCTGETLTPMFYQTDSDFGYIGFRGQLDGQGYSISNINISQPSSTDVGLFAYTNQADIMDIGISGSVEGTNCVGALVGSAINTHINGVISSVSIVADSSGGGLVGCYTANDSISNSITDNTVTADVNSSSTGGGFIGSYQAADPSNTVIADNSFEGSLIGSGSYLGGIIGSMYADDESITNVESNNSTGVDLPSASEVGGIVGYVYLQGSATITFDENEVLGDVVGASSVGGVIGEANSDIDDDEALSISSTNLAINVTSTDDDNVGGLVGYADDMLISSSSSSGNVSGADDEVGGLVGEAYSVTIVESYSSGSVVADDSFAGGLVGRNSETTIVQSFSTASVTGDDRVGGLVGANGGYIFDSYARGDVTGDSQVGGLAGRCGRDITNSYSTGMVTGNDSVGGFIGEDDSCEVVDSFWDVETSGQELSAGTETGKITAEMKDIRTFTDTETEGLETVWVFSGTWSITETANDGYPCLIWSMGNCPQSYDSDDIPAYIEIEAPNNGDANNDGSRDAEQTHVSSFVNPVTQLYTVVQADSACTLAEITAESESQKTVQDSAYSYASGLVNFTANCGTNGYTTSVRVIVYGSGSGNFVLRKHNPINNSYFNIDGATVTAVTIGGQAAHQVTYQITDGGLLDIDGLVNGTIIDPVGLATLIAGVPNTGFVR